MKARNGVGDEHELLDNENRQRAERLAHKISHLKTFAIDIETETKEHNRLLDSVDNDFDSNLGFLSGGRNRLNRLLTQGSQNRKFMCYLSLILTIFLVILYYFLTRHLFK